MYGLLQSESPPRGGRWQVNLGSKKYWVLHIETLEGVDRSDPRWADAVRTHRALEPDCPICKARRAERRAQAQRRAKADVYESLGMVRCKGALGGSYWE
jgi:hypothetical protein